MLRRGLEQLPEAALARVLELVQRPQAPARAMREQAQVPARVRRRAPEQQRPARELDLRPEETVRMVQAEAQLRRPTR
jgi:hypothetical protein